MKALGDGLELGNVSLYGLYPPHRFAMWSPTGYGFYTLIQS